MPFSFAPARVAVITTGLAFGAGTAIAELTFVILATPLLAFRGLRARVLAGARVFAELERARLARFLHVETSPDYDGDRALRYLALRSPVGGLGAGIFLLIAWGAVFGVIMAYQLVTGQPIGGGDIAGDWYDPITVVLFGILLVFLAVQGLVGVAALDRQLAHRFLGPGERELLRRRVSELATTRAEVLEAVDDERRRIERDLHDGVQQRVVALGMLLGRARRASEPEHGHGLLVQAHDAAQDLLVELREVTWRVYPVALDAEGLAVALESLAERSSVPVTVTCALPTRPAPAVEVVAYFVASEAVTNAAKHSGATRIGIDVRVDATALTVRITDDGNGGADLTGDGLSGLARRVAAADGEFTVDSPPGGPTIVTARLPCA